MKNHRRRLPTAANFTQTRHATVSETDELGPRLQDKKLIVVFRPKPGELPHVLNCTDFLNRSKLAQSAADFIYSTHRTYSRDSRENAVKYFRHFFKFADHIQTMFQIDISCVKDISTETMELYIKWLDGESTIKSNINLSVLTKKSRYKFIYRFLRWCKTSKKYATEISSSLFLEKNPWLNAHLSIAHHEALSLVQVAQIRAACRDEIENILSGLHATRKAFSRKGLLSSTTPYERSARPYKDDVHLCLRHLHTVIADGRITKNEMEIRMPGLARVVVPPFFTLGKIIPLLYITPRSIVPFVILLAFHTAFNPVTLLDLRWSKVSRLLGNDGKCRWRIEGDKIRGNSGPQVRTFRRDKDDPFGVVSLLIELRRFNTRIKRYLSAAHADSIFVFWQALGTPPSGFIRHPSRKIAGLWDSSLAKFISAHKLPKFTLVNIRSTAGDLVDFMSEGDIEAQQTIQQHRSKGTTETSYRAKSAKARRAEGLAEAMDQRQRVIDSNATTSKQTMFSGEDMSAATPGFRCWDPRASPIKGQKEGRLCSAYGQCPACPLSYIHLQDRYLVPRLLQLRAAFEAARLRMNQQRWWVDWQPAYEALLEDWFPKVPDLLWQTFSNTKLPPIPSIE